jgi:hypothetical protein
MPASPSFAYLVDQVQPFWRPELSVTQNVALVPSVTYAAGQILGEGGSATAVWSLTMGGSAAAGTFTVTYDGQTTSALAYNTTSTALQAALQALPAIGSGNVTVTGPSSQVYTITFAGALAGTPVGVLTAAATGLTGGALAITQTTAGQTATGTFGKYTHGGSYAVPKAILQFACATDAQGLIWPGATAGSAQWGFSALTVPAYFFGWFSIGDLVGIDTTNTITDSTGWSLEQGSLAGPGILRIG